MVQTTIDSNIFIVDVVDPPTDKTVGKDDEGNIEISFYNELIFEEKLQLDKKDVISLRVNNYIYSCLLVGNYLVRIEDRNEFPSEDIFIENIRNNIIVNDVQCDDGIIGGKLFDDGTVILKINKKINNIIQ